MNILVRADSSSYIGTGHIMRDLVLAKQYKNENIIFATQNLVGNINHQIIEAGYKIEFVKSNDFEELNDLIKKLNIDMVIIDNYDIDYDFEKKYKNKVPENCELRCGAKYTLLRDEFLEIKKAKKRVKKKFKTIFLGLGGADHKNLNIKILKVVEKFKKSLKVNLVTTTANKHLEELKVYCKDKKWINLQINSNEVAKLMSKSDFAIVTPSVTANEIFYLDLPMITIKTAKNQNQMHKYLKKKGYFTMKKFDKQKLNKYLKLFLKR